VDTSGGGGGGSSELPAATGSDDGTPPDLAKYEKMAKMLPQGAVENAMTRDGVDPGWLFGADCVTVKSNKRPIKNGGGAPAAPAAAAPPAASAQRPPQQQQQQGYQQAAQQQQPPQQQFATPTGVWQQIWSPQHNAMYYLNSQTQQSTWIPPPGFNPAAQPAPAAQAPVVALVAMVYPFSPTGANPLEIMAAVGDRIEVTQFGQDGWIVGRNQRTGQQGLVPTNYTQKL